MTVKRVQFSNIVQNQLPTYVRTDFPLISEFLKSYYQAQEFQGAPIDLIQNIDQYVKLNEQTSLTENVILDANITQYDTTIPVEAFPKGTNGFPDSYGLLKIDNEIITYTGKTDTSFTGCVRGFCGITTYQAKADPQQLVFETSSAAAHDGSLYDPSNGRRTRQGVKIENLTVLFLKQFLKKTKNQLLPGFEDRTLHTDLDQNIFIKQAKDFYSSKGTDRSFQILFGALYNEDVDIIRPREFLFTPSNANYRITDDLMVEAYDGDPLDLDQATLYQDAYGDLTKAYGPVTNIEKINVGVGETYYRLSMDAGYNRDSRVTGAVYGDFSVHASTKIIGDVAIGQSFVDVDSTVGFAHSGNLDVVYSDSTTGIVSYTSKTINEFQGVSNVVGILSDGTNVGIDTYAYGAAFGNPDKIVKVKITSVLKDLDYPTGTYYYSSNDTARIKTLGINDAKFKSRDWFYNTAPTYKVHSIVLLDASDWTYKVNLFKLHYVRLGDSAAIIGPDGVEKATTVIDITSSTSMTIRGQGQLDINDTYTFKRNILKVLSNNFPGTEVYSTNVQNTYKTEDKLLVASASIPSYNSQALNTTYRQVKFSGTFVGTEFNIGAHGFRTGDAIVYAAQKEIQTYTDYKTGLSATRTVILSELFDEGLYFVYRVSDTSIKLSTSRSNIYNDIFVTIDSARIVVDNIIKPYEFKDKVLKSQRLLREVSTPHRDGIVSETLPGATGILINGVEVLNYKSNDLLRYGKIEEIEVTSAGSNYDIIDPPVLNVSDAVGSGATGYAGLTGSLQEIRVSYEGFDYEETPLIKIAGGNGEGATASVNMKLVEHAPYFNAESVSGNVGLTTDTIGFSTYHKFRNAEKVIYLTGGQEGIAGITTDAVYFVGTVGDYGVKLYKTEGDALAGINTVDLTGYGFGQHQLRSYNKKSVLESVNITNSGSGYQNKKLSVNPTGINTSSDVITLENHHYKNGEIVTYSSTGTEIGGLSSSNQYKVIVVDNDSFKLANAGVGGTNTSDYAKGIYTDLSSIGSGIHYFNYQPITATLVGKVGISSIGSETFQATVQPIFRGECTSVHLENKGVGYGSSEIVNLDRQPEVTLIPGAQAELQPVVDYKGQIIEVIVLNAGKQYLSPPNIVIEGDGVGAVVTPIIENGTISSVKVLEGGVGYAAGNVTATILYPGTGVKFNSIVQSWRINLFEKNLSTFTDDDGFITKGRNVDFELQYTHLYAPRKLRESVYGRNSSGDILYGKSDLKRVASVEVESDDHSPIIGWAYDGHPIYGPYGYIEQSGGVVTLMKSSYSLKLKDNRPPTSQFPEGIFVEDYTYTKVKSEDYLDENNGRFCVTPEYPLGTYAYFATINTITADTAGPFKQYRRPVFPYLIGTNYNSIPNDFNYKYLSNQESFDLRNTAWLRNTDPYNLMEGTLEYEYISIPNKLKQVTDVKAVSPGVIETVGVETGGNLYRVGDQVVLNNTNTRGSGADVQVSKVLGKPITYVSTASSTISGVEIYPTGRKGEYELVSANPHGFKDNDLVSISGLSTTSSKIGGVWRAGITTTSFELTGIGTTTVGVAADSVTGIVTYFNVKGDFAKLRSNDVLGIGTEQIKVLNIEPHYSRFRALRGINTTGYAHTVTSVLNLDHRTINVNAGFNTDYEYSVNKELYFNPVHTVGLGTMNEGPGGSAVGAGYTLNLGNPGAGVTEIYIPLRSLYIRDHGLETGDQLTYSVNVGAGLSVMLDTDTGTQISTLEDETVVYAARIDSNLIGISTVKVGVGTTGTFVGIASTEQTSSTMYFTGLGTGVYHSLKTNYSVITGEINRNLVTVSTGETHGLSGSDTVWIDINPSNTGINTLTYNDFNRRLTVNAQSFTASGVNTSTNAITIANHGLVSGEKIVHTATTPSAGLSDNGMYFVVRVDDNSFKLTNNYYNSNSLKPAIVGITSASAGTIRPINPPLTVYKNSTVTFDLSDSSLSYVNNGTTYPAFELNFYADENFTEIWNKTPDATLFNVQRVGTVGITADAKVNLTVNENIPEKLFYRLDPIYESDTPAVKTQILTDKEVNSFSQVQSKVSVYNGKQIIGVGSTNTFTYSIAETPELSTYAPAPAQLSYETDATEAYGGITQFEIKNPGRNYYSLPGVSTVTSTDGKGAIVSVASTSIGKVIKTKIENIGYNFPVDTTIRPDVNLGTVCEIEALTSFESIGINSRGRGYTSAPELLVFDGKTKKQIKDVDLKYELGDSNVTILQNTFGMSNLEPTILPVQNSNGVGISTVGWSTNSYDVTVTLNVGFSTANSFPFAIGDKVLVEGISVGVGSTGGGFNSADYDYKLFTITGLDENYGGIGTVGYRLDNSLLEGRVPGEYDGNASTGRIIPEKYFPMFNVKLKSNDYLEGETVKTGDSTGTVESWDPNVGILNISTGDEFDSGDVIIGQTSNTQGRAFNVLSFPTTLQTGAFSRVENGWETSSGFINDSVQRVQDSFYYQNFSYSLKSRVAYDTWNDVVSSTNHTAGFKKFSDYQLETPADALTSGVSMPVGLTTDSASFEVVSDLKGVGNLNCVNDFDLVTENALVQNSGTVSDEIVFNSRILQDYWESVGNRVLSIDDFSGSFNSNPRSTPFSIVSQFPLNTRQCMKYITYVRDRRYVGQRQIMIVDLVHDDSFGYINQYGQAGTVYPLGSFDFNIVGTDGRLLFYPNNYKVNDYDVVAVAYNLDNNILGIGSTSLGCAEIFTTSTEVSSGSSAQLIGIGYTYRSLKVLASISGSTHNEYEMEEINIIHDGTTVDVMEYGQLTSNLGAYVSTSGFGTFVPSISGTDIIIDFKANTGIACTVNTIIVGLSSEAYVGVDTNQLKHVDLESRTTSIASSTSPGIHTVGRYLTLSDDDDHYDAAYFMIQVSDTTNKTYEMSELIMVDDYNTTLGTTNAYIVEYGNVATVSGLGTFGAQVNTAASAKYSELMFTPNAGIAVQVKVFMNAFQIEDDDKDIIEFANGSIETMYNLYEGTENSIKRSFELQHRENDIFNKSFLGADSTIVDTTNNTIRLPNHFFVSGEKVKYVHAGAGTSMAIGCETTSGFSGVGVTDKLPGDLFIYKVNEDTVKIATSAENALKTIPDTLGITTVGIGTSHRFASINQNAKAIIALDNIIQSPVVATSVTTGLAKTCYTTDDLLTFTGITSFIGGDLIKLGDEIMRIDGVGIGSTNVIRVRRPWLGTTVQNYSPATQVTKVNGNYNIVGNTLTFSEAPYGNLPFGTSTNPPDDRDWTGISTSSSFQGRTFMRSGVEDTTDETYTKNMVLDDISTEFTGSRRNFNLKSDGDNVTGIATAGGVILINDIFQGPGALLDYTMNENAGITSIRFTGTATSIGNDVNTSNLPIGGVIVSVGSTEGFGYQPLVAAGGTPVVSSAGTFTGITLSNTGSGYRSGIGQVVNVGIQTQSDADTTRITHIGKATIGSEGALTGVAVTSTFVSYKPRDIINVGYSRSTGISTVTTAFDHGLSTGDEVALSGIAFTCDYAPAVAISTAIYDGTSGIMTVTTAVGHGLTTVGTQKSNVILTGMAFTCTLDSGAQNHIYPRNRDRFYDTAIEVTGVGNTLTANNAVYDPVVGIVTVTTSANHGMIVGDYVTIADNSLTFTCAKDNDETEHTYPRAGDYASGKWLSVLTVPGVKKFSVKILETTPSSNTSAHTFVRAASSGITTQTGNITLNVSASATKDQFPHTFVGTAGTGPVKTGGNYGHNFVGASADSVVTGGNYTHTFVSGMTSETIIWNAAGTATAGVGTTQPTDATYDPTTGDLVLTLPNHDATTSETLGIGTGGISFRCALDGYATVHAYPRTTDPIHNTKTAITGVTGDTVTINVGTSTHVKYTPTHATGTLTFEEDYPHKFVSAGTSAVFTGGNYAHAFVSAATNAVNVQSGAESGNEKTPSDAGYDASTGVLTLTFGSAHGMSTSDTITLDNESIVFTCARDANATNHAYPRASDPIAGITTAITKTSATAFTINVGMSTVVNHPVSIGTYYPKTGELLLEVGGGHAFSTSTSKTITDADYDPIAGIMTMTSTSHGIATGEYVRIPEGAITFTCNKDGNATNHSYPRSSVGDRDRTGSNWLAVTDVSTNTFSVDVGAAGDVDAGTHSFVSASSPVEKANSMVGIGTSTLVFTCGKDNHATEHTYPRLTDPVYNKQIGVGATYAGTISLFVGITTYAQVSNKGAAYNGATGELVLSVANHNLNGSSTHTVVHADYNPTTGIMTCMVPSHTFSNGDRVKFADGSLTFTCTEDSHATEHTYPRSTDPKSNKWLAITGVTTSVFEVNVLDTAPSTNTGVHTFVTATTDGLTKAGDSIRLDNESLTFTCGMDGHGSNHAYPRGTDPYYDTAVSVGATTSGSISVNVGRTPLVSYGASTATYYQANGDLILGIGTHNVTKGDSIKLARESLIFTCTKDGNSTQHRYPREGDPSYAGVPVAGITSARIFSVNIGVTTTTNYYTGVTTATVQPVIIAPRPTDEAAPGATVLNVINTKSFEVQTGISSRNHVYARGGQVEKPMDVIIDDPLSYTNIPLQYASGSSGIGSEATIDIVVGQASSITDFRVNNTGYAYGMGETLTVPFGGGSGIPTSTSFTNNQFEVEVTKIFTDEFTGWTLGTLEALDDVARLFNGGRMTFPLSLNGTAVSIRAAKGSVINVQDVLLIFVNDILQVPGEGYKFDGGSIIEFTEAPKAGDSCKILFYKGTGDDVDVIFRNIIETVKIGDNLQIYEKDDQRNFWRENPRNVTQVTSTDTVDTNPYAGPGNTSIESMLRPVKWCRQTEDKIINDLPVGKDRELYEPVINPTSLITQSVGIGSTQVYVTSVRPFFNPKNELSTAVLTFQDKIKFARPSGTKVAAAATAVVSTAGTISSFTLSEGGIGYGATPSVSIGKTTVGVGTTADAIGTASISNGVVTGIAVSVQGSGYSQTSPPAVLIGPPSTKEEECSVNNYFGDEGIVVGFGTTTIAAGVGTTAFMMDLFIPVDSFLRQSLYMVDALDVGGITTVSGITTGDYFVIDESNVGVAVTSIVSVAKGTADTVGTGISFIDNVYQVYHAETVQVNILGVGYTDIRRIYTAIKDPMHFGSTSGITSSPNYANYSWGKIDLVSRGLTTSYTAYTSSGVVGFSTSPIVERSASLKYKSYNV